MLVETTPLSVPSGQRKLVCIGIGDIDNADSNRYIVALTIESAINAMKSYNSYTLDEIIEDVLNGIKLDSASLIDIWFEGNDLQLSTFFPAFNHFIN